MSSGLFEWGAVKRFTDPTRLPLLLLYGLYMQKDGMIRLSSTIPPHVSEVRSSSTGHMNSALLCS